MLVYSLLDFVFCLSCLFISVCADGCVAVLRFICLCLVVLLCGTTLFGLLC